MAAVCMQLNCIEEHMYKACTIHSSSGYNCNAQYTQHRPMGQAKVESILPAGWPAGYGALVQLCKWELPLSTLMPGQPVAWQAA